MVAFAFPEHLYEKVQLREKYCKVDAIRFLQRTCTFYDILCQNCGKKINKLEKN